MTLASPLIDKAAWLTERRSGIGASEAAAVLGASPYASPREVYLQKLGIVGPAQENEAMRWGNLLEPAIAAEYARRTGNAVVDTQLFLRHPERGFLLATLDGMTEAGYPAEFKTTSEWGAKAIGEEGTEDLPEHWLLQAHQQMYVSGTERVDFAILIGGQRLEIRPVFRNEALIEAMLPRLAEFWACVQRRMPPTDTHVADRRIMHLLYPGCEGEVDLAWDDVQTVDRYLALGPEAKGLENMRAAHKAALLDRLGNASMGFLPDGRVVTRKIVEYSESVVSYTRKAYTVVDLRVKAPKKERS